MEPQQRSVTQSSPPRHARRVMTWRHWARLGTLAVPVAMVLAMPMASAAPASAPSVASKTSAKDAAREIGTFRTSMSAQLNDYLTRYGPRLAEAERARVSELITQSDTDLAQVQSLANTTATWERRRNRARAVKAAADAVRSFDSAYARAEAAVAEMKPILQPRLSIFEALDAQSALDQRMAAYRGLGRQLRAVQAGLRSSPS